jgi:hypothetical protein
LLCFTIETLFKILHGIGLTICFIQKRKIFVINCETKFTESIRIFRVFFKQKGL